jgi:glutathione S-transferase
MILFPWALQVRLGYKHTSGVGARDFLTFDKYTHLNKWMDRILERPAVKRGLRVCNYNGVAKPWLEEGDRMNSKV